MHDIVFMCKCSDTWTGELCGRGKKHAQLAVIAIRKHVLKQCSKLPSVVDSLQRVPIDTAVANNTIDRYCSDSLCHAKNAAAGTKRALDLRMPTRLKCASSRTLVIRASAFAMTTTMTSRHVPKTIRRVNWP